MRDANDSALYESPDVSPGTTIDDIDPLERPDLECDRDDWDEADAEILRHPVLAGEPNPFY